MCVTKLRVMTVKVIDFKVLLSFVRNLVGMMKGQQQYYQYVYRRPYMSADIS